MLKNKKRPFSPVFTVFLVGQFMGLMGGKNKANKSVLSVLSPGSDIGTLCDITKGFFFPKLLSHTLSGKWSEHRK